jgi:hypothetical protein
VGENSVSETKTVWVVEEGEYSDYRVVGVFSSEANAKQVAELVGGEVAEWPVDPNIAELNQGLHIYFVQMRRDGTVDRCEHQKIDAYGLTGIGVTMWRRSQAPAYRGQNMPDVMHAKVWAKDEQHAIKIANEHRAEWIASGKWGSDR